MLKQRLLRELVPEPHAAILHQIIGVGLDAMPELVSRGDQRIGDRAKTMQRQRPGAIDLTIGLFLTLPIGGAEIERVARGRQHKLRRLLPLLGEHGALQWEEASQLVLPTDRKSTRLNSSHTVISYAVFCL